MDGIGKIHHRGPGGQYLDVPADGDEIAGALGISPSMLAGEYPLDFIDAGLRTLIVPIAGFRNAVSFYPDQGVLKAFCLDRGVDIVLAFSRETAAEGFIAHTRVFAPKFGYLEDPATGSGNSALGSYMLKNGMWAGAPARVEQGGDNIRFNTVRLMAKGGSVLFGGGAALRIEGTYYMP